MKKIGTKISLVIICFSCISTVIVSATCLIQGENLIKKEANEKLLSVVAGYSAECSADLKIIEYQVGELKSHIENTVDMKRLVSDKSYLAKYEEELDPFFFDYSLRNTTGIASWCYFNPELSESPHDIYYVDQNDDSIPDRQNYTPFSYFDNTPTLTDDKYWWYGAVDSKKPVWTNPYDWTLANGEIVTAVSHATPVYIDNILVCVVGTHYLFDKLHDCIERMNVHNTGFAALYNEKLDAIVHPTMKSGNRNNSENLLSIDGGKLSKFANEIINNKTGITGYEDANDEKKLTAYSRLINDWVLTINSLESDIYNGLHILLIQILIAIASCIVLSLIIALFFGKIITRPLLKVIDGANKISTGDLSVSVDINTNDEIKTLADSINNMVKNTVELQKELSDLAYYDSLTKIPNKNYFEKRARKLVAISGEQYAYIVIDINKFRIINDTFGIRRGNELLIHIAKHISEEIGEGELCARINADCFHMFLKFNNTTLLEQRIKMLSERISNSYYEKHSDYKLSIAIGIYIIDDRSAPISSMGDKAKIALSKVKGIHQSSIYTYNDTISKQISDEIEIEQSMEKALENEEFKMYLQPKFDVKTMRVVGAEALVRWINPEKGIISPDSFIPIFEKNGFIEQLDMFMLNSACKLIKDWERLMLPIVPISINQSRQYINRPSHILAIIDTLKQYKIEPALIELEITETAFFDSQVEMAEVVKELHDNGFTISMDDFGSGCSSLNMLQNTIIDILKIDKNFFSQSIDTARGKTIIGSVIAMASDLNIRVVAEGIETKEQLEFLRTTDCTTGQGYFFSKPIPVSDFNNFVLEKGIL